MKLDKFKELLNKDVDTFIKFWQESAVTEPDHFPDSLAVEEWYEQFLIFIGSEPLEDV
jgi:hypothetical protein